jgi:glycopeptide antibiotics resistance protein
MILEFTPGPFLVGLGILVFLLAYLWRQKRSLSYLFCCAVFGIYMLALIGATLFPMPIFDNTGWYSSPAFILSRVNLIPFYYKDYYNIHAVLIEIVQNILLTVPFGYGISFIAGIRTKNIFWLAAGVGLGLETAQLAASLLLAGAYRTVDITDVLLNAAGFLIGYGLFWISARLYLAIT